MNVIQLVICLLRALVLPVSFLPPLPFQRRQRMEPIQMQPKATYCTCFFPFSCTPHPTEIRCRHLSGNRKHRSNTERQDERTFLAENTSVFASTTDKYACSLCLVEIGSSCNCSARGFSTFNDMEIVDSGAFDAYAPFAEICVQTS